MIEDDAVLMQCESETCGWTGELAEVILRPNEREHLLCPVCGEVVTFVEEDR